MSFIKLVSVQLILVCAATAGATSSNSVPSSPAASSSVISVGESSAELKIFIYMGNMRNCLEAGSYRAACHERFGSILQGVTPQDLAKFAM